MGVLRKIRIWGGLTMMWVLILGLHAVPTLADAGSEADPEFGGQILTLTEPKVEVNQKGDSRFQDNGNGTVTDTKMKLIWTQMDSYQKLKKWLNWNMAQDYIKDLNEKKFAGHSDWRLPTREELASLYDKNYSIPWNYYWTKNEIHMDPIFGNSNCCYWTSEEHKGDMAWGFNFIRGKPYLSMKGGIQLSLTVIRAVRKMDVN